ncbi:hypothetical protein J6590_042346 [Homalodisca vitripennis]|nr:hypothetical protein J6590_042346 [Homalodisca vitripennis]
MPARLLVVCHRDELQQWCARLAGACALAYCSCITASVTFNPICTTQCTSSNTTPKATLHRVAIQQWCARLAGACALAYCSCITASVTFNPICTTQCTSSNTTPKATLHRVAIQQWCASIISASTVHLSNTTLRPLYTVLLYNSGVLGWPAPAHLLTAVASLPLSPSILSAPQCTSSNTTPKATLHRVAIRQWCASIIWPCACSLALLSPCCYQWCASILSAPHSAPPPTLLLRPLYTVLLYNSGVLGWPAPAHLLTAVASLPLSPSILSAPHSAPPPTLLLRPHYTVLLYDSGVLQSYLHHTVHLLQHDS